jgi:hypothetical protein
MTDMPLGLQTIPKTWANLCKGLFAIRPITYIFLIFLASLAAYVYKFRKETIFACQAAMYSSDRYIASCNGTHYADYEHGAFAFGLESKAEDFARDADVLFLGNSRLQFAFSTSATVDWFSAASTRYYLLGFTYFENMVFAEDLLRKIRPRAKVYVINVDDFFDRTETPPVNTILHDPTARARYETKRLWQRVHDPLCKVFAVFCGHQFAIFRSRETGAYYAEDTAKLQKTAPVSYDRLIAQDVVDRNTANAIDFLKQFAEGKCVILTAVPLVGTRIGNADAIASGLGMKLVTPGKLEGLQTWDGYHLDRPSAERWSRAFFQAAGPEIRSCLGEHGASLQ